jgi:hypothetical protein
MQTWTDPADATLIAESETEPELFGLVFDRHAPVIYGYIARRPGRDALLLFTEGLAYAEVAAALGVPVGTVSSRIARARRKVKRALGGVNPTGVMQEANDE